MANINASYAFNTVVIRRMAVEGPRDPRQVLVFRGFLVNVTLFGVTSIGVISTQLAHGDSAMSASIREVR